MKKIPSKKRGDHNHLKIQKINNLINYQPAHQIAETVPVTINISPLAGSSGNTPIELEITDGNNFPREYANVPSGYCFRLTAYEMTNIILLIFNSIVNTLPLV